MINENMTKQEALKAKKQSLKNIHHHLQCQLESRTGVLRKVA